jgi:acetyl esterase
MTRTACTVRNPLRRNYLVIGLATVFALSTLLSCDKHDNDDIDDTQYERISPSKPKPTWAPNITKQMQAVIETLDTIAPAPLHTLKPQQARQSPSFADAYKRVMSNFGIPMPATNVDTMGRDIPVAGGTINVRLYTPHTAKSSYPVIVYYHGGGWVVATIDTYNSSAQALAERTEAIVVSVEYRKGPEFKFPTAHNDAFAAYKWVLNNAGSIKGDVNKIAVAGESAGGNMAITVSMMARDSGVKLPVHALAVYPVASNDLNLPSKIQYAMAKPLSTPDLPWFLMHYLNDMSESASPLINLVGANLSGLPKTTIIAAEIDPLQSEGMLLRDKLQAAGVSTTYKFYTGVTHEFFGMDQVLPEARDAQTFAAQELKRAF